MQSILGNVGLLVLGLNSVTAAKDIEAMSEKLVRARRKSFSYSGGQQYENFSYEPTIRASEYLKLSKHCIYLESGIPIKLRKVYYFRLQQQKERRKKIIDFFRRFFQYC